jgi:hypothetical protein
MTISLKTRIKAMILVVSIVIMTVGAARMHADTGMCGGQTTTLPFTDVPASSIFFCSIAEAYFSALTNGTSAATYSPSANVPREQMAAFVTRTMDYSLRRSGKRTPLDQYWTTQGTDNIALTNVGQLPYLSESDGADLWVANHNSDTVSRVRASDGRLLETWTGAAGAAGVLCAMGKVFITGYANPGSLYQIDPTQPAGAVTVVSSALDQGPFGIAYDGQRIWTANFIAGSVSIITLHPTSVTNVIMGFTAPQGMIYDGSNIWVTDSAGSVDKLDSSGAIVQSVGVGSSPRFPGFDGTNIWVPNQFSNSVSVIRASGGLTGTVLATLSGNGLNGPLQATFDGERILVTNYDGDSVSLWKASDLTPIGTFSTGANTSPFGACSDGLNMWITFSAFNGKLARF